MFRNIGKTLVHFVPLHFLINFSTFCFLKASAHFFGNFSTFCSVTFCFKKTSVHFVPQRPSPFFGKTWIWVRLGGGQRYFLPCRSDAPSHHKKIRKLESAKKKNYFLTSNFFYNGKVLLTLPVRRTFGEVADASQGTSWGQKNSVSRQVAGGGEAFASCGQKIWFAVFF